MNVKNNADMVLFTKEQYAAELIKAYNNGYADGAKAAQEKQTAKKSSGKATYKVNGEETRFRATVAESKEDK